MQKIMINQTQDNIKILNPITLPIQGSYLIESSAGTGKTYTLILIYLRLLLGLGNNFLNAKPLSIEEILVVTFTKVTAEELRNRIKDSIYRMRVACMYGYSDDSMLEALLKQLKNVNQAELCLITAEKQFDKAAIFTIHSFCQRILSYSSIKLGFIFNQTLLEDESSIYQQASYDFWRKYCYTLPIEIACLIQNYWSGPDSLLKDLLPYLQGDIPFICDLSDMKESIEQKYKSIIADIDNLKNQWRLLISENTESVLFIKDYLINDYSIYNNKNLPNWLKIITDWSKKTTKDHKIPKELKKLRDLITKGNIIVNKKLFKHFLLDLIEKCYHKILSLHPLIFSKALNEIRYNIKQKKQLRLEIGFNDLLSILDQLLSSHNGNNLAKLIRTLYPISIIDEFQDIDPQQYRLFHKIYINQINCGLVLIGDPKQSIYSFRGADIYTYMRAKSEINNYYIFNTNWRSSLAMINAINNLFQLMPIPFIFKEIPFFPVNHIKTNVKLRLIVRKQLQPALRFWLQPGNRVSLIEYQKFMAYRCANTIYDWLNAAKENQAWLEGHNNYRQQLCASDMVILVRDHKEASLIHNALMTFMISSVYLSNQKSVFETIEAQEIFWVLQAILNPKQNNLLRRALATNLLSIDAATIDSLNKDEYLLEQKIEEFTLYHYYWVTKGVLPMLHYMMIKCHIADNLLKNTNSKRRLIDFLHLGELIQEASINLNNELAVINWLDKQIKSPKNKTEKYLIRLENHNNLIKIITIYKSKGLEFPIVFLPFAANLHIQKKLLFHDRINYDAWLDLNKDPKNLKLIEEERIAEDIRLLYVSLTRSIYHCSVGIAPIFCNIRKKTNTSDLHLNALGYLIQQGSKSDSIQLRIQLKYLIKLANKDIELCEKLPSLHIMPLKLKSVTYQHLKAKKFKQPLYDLWRITSYTDLSQYTNLVNTNNHTKLNEIIIEKNEQQELTPHTFMRGSSYGTFLHSLLENLDFSQMLNTQWLSDQLIKYNIDLLWLPTISKWIEQIIHAPIDNSALSLYHLSSADILTELQFYFPIDVALQAETLNKLCKFYDPISALCPSLDFPKIKGMMKGFIDLIFRWQNRYYLIDYKSNWLGKDSNAYNIQGMKQSIITNRYDLQYQIYTLALHRFLRHRLKNYNYQRDFGGLYYLFLRGITIPYSSNGIYYCRMDNTFVDLLDKLFIGNKRL